MIRVDTSRFMAAVITSLTLACAGFEYLVREAFAPELVSYPDVRRHEDAPLAPGEVAKEPPSAVVASGNVEPKG
jgi:hypothetical protein